MKYLAPDYVYTADGFVADAVVSVSDNGEILDIVSRSPEAVITDDLSGLALLPGFVNTHSHVFQWALRGHTHRPLSLQDSFWTWRRAMYTEANRLDPDHLYQNALKAYHEMVTVGYTSVGEFHYVHHQPGGKPYAEPNAMAQAVISAAHDVGIRPVLLMVAYAQAGFGQPLEPDQLRFADASVEAFLERVEDLRLTGVAIGLAPHSVRAVPESWYPSIFSYSHKYNLPIHIHADEQISEIEQCRQEHDCTPIELLERFEMLSSSTTIVHATHASSHEIELLRRHQSCVCVCPTTEGDLGDGIAPYKELVAAGIRLSIGADSNTRLDPIEELRWAEYTARMRYQRRRVLLTDPMASPGPFLLEMGTRNGASALGLKSGVIAPGMQADFVATDLKHPTLQGWTERDLLDGLFFGGSAAVIEQTWVQGKRIF